MKRNKKNKIIIHIGVTNNSVLTTDLIEKGLLEFNKVSNEFFVEQITPLPFLRKIPVYLEQYKLDILIIDSILEKQDSEKYIREIKLQFPEIIIIVLAKFIDDSVIELQQNGFISEYTTLPFQDANLWNCIEKAYKNPVKPKEKKIVTDIHEEEFDEKPFVYKGRRIRMNGNANLDINTLQNKKEDLNQKSEVKTSAVNTDNEDSLFSFDLDDDNESDSKEQDISRKIEESDIEDLYNKVGLNIKDIDKVNTDLNTGNLSNKLAGADRLIKKTVPVGSESNPVKSKELFDIDFDDIEEEP